MANTLSSSYTPGFGLHRTKSQVFVEIPPSPLFKARVMFTQSKVDDISAFHKPKSHKENAPPLSTKISLNNVPINKAYMGKRKVQDNDDDVTLPGTKKAKMPKSSDEANYVTCHQCRSKKPPPSVLQCTGLFKKTGNRCKAFYCNTCLRNRYGKVLEIIAHRNSPGSRDEDGKAKYHFICPRCDGNCNCAPCRKRRGLAPVGRFTTHSGESVREILEKNPKASGRLPKSAVIAASKTSEPNKADVSVKTVNTSNDINHGIAKSFQKRQNTTGDVATKRKLKTVPEPVWIPIPHMWSKHEVEDRIHLREFVLRFNLILKIGPRNLEELDDFTSLHDPSTKAILLSLLDILAIEDDTHKKLIQEKVKILRGLGLNWAKIISVLYDLRNCMPKGHVLSAIPDLSQSDSEVSYDMRRTRAQGVSANQLLPVLLHLIQAAGEGASVRQELEEGYKQAKEVRAVYLKAIREETERWAVEKNELNTAKPEGEKQAKTNEGVDAWKIKFQNADAEHKAIVVDIRNSHKPEMDWCASRFTRLGCDTEGRLYYALSASGPHRGKKERLPSEAERSAMKRWGWFIAVFGKPGTIIQRESEDGMDEDGEDDPNAERWWGFAGVEDMRKLSKWLAFCAETSTPSNEGRTRPTESSTRTPVTSYAVASRLGSPSGTTAILRSRSLSPISNLLDSRSDDNDHQSNLDKTHDANLTQPSSARMKALAKAILEFAEFTDWRLSRDQTFSKRNGNDGTAPSKFYD